MITGIMKFGFGYRSIDSFIIAFRLLLFNDKNIDILMSFDFLFVRLFGVR